MAIKDIMKNLAGKSTSAALEKKDEAARALLPSDAFPIIRPEQMEMSRYQRIPLAGLGALGVAFAHMPKAARTIVETVTTSIATKGTLFVGINPKGTSGFLQMNEQGILGNIMQVNPQGKQVIAGRMRFKPLQNGLPVNQTRMMTIPFDPTTLAIAATLYVISEKLDALQRTAEDILQFLKLDKQSRQRGNLNELADIMTEYKRHCEEEKFCQLRNVEVQNIRREAQQDMLFYQEQIATKLQRQQMLHGIQQAQNLTGDVLEEFYEYQLACYLYAYSTYLDVLLQKRFESESLEMVRQKMQEMEERYSRLHAKCHEQIESYQAKAIERVLMGGLGGAMKAVGRAVAGIPVLRDGPVDEALIKVGESVESFNKETVNRQMESLAALQDSHMRPFVDNLHTLDRVHNQQGGMLTDGDNLYIMLA